MAELTLEERVAALENELTYELRFSGERVDEAISAALKIHRGTSVFESSGKNQLASVELDISGFVPKQVFVSVRSSFTPTPYYNICTTVRNQYGKYYAMLCMGPNADSDIVSLPEGTYNIDWLALE